MNLRTFEAESMARALALVKHELGPGAVILRTRTLRRGGVFGIGARQLVEITASDDVSIVPPKMRRDVLGESAPTTALQRVYRQPLQANSERGTRNAEHKTPPAQTLSDLSPAPRSELRVPSSPAPAADPALSQEVRQIRQMVHRMMRLQVTQPRPELSDPLFNHYLGLLEQEVAEELADEVIEAVRKKLIGRNGHDAELVRQELAQQVALLLSTETHSPLAERPLDGRPRIVALIGPTGVGKTTTIAKLAANLKLRERKKVALITIDTYRIAAVDQLKTYAQIISVPLHVVMTPHDMAAALARCSGCDVVLVDTAGRSQRDEAKLEDLARFLAAADPHEVHLVLSCTSSQAVLVEAVERFKSVRVDGVILTKLDEAVSFGVLLNVARKVNKRLSYVTTGQDVPHDIEAGEPRRLAGLILGEAL